MVFGFTLTVWLTTKLNPFVRFRVTVGFFFVELPCHINCTSLAVGSSNARILGTNACGIRWSWKGYLERCCRRCPLKTIVVAIEEHLPQLEHVIIRGGIQQADPFAIIQLVITVVVLSSGIKLVHIILDPKVVHMNRSQIFFFLHNHRKKATVFFSAVIITPFRYRIFRATATRALLSVT